MRDPGNEVAFYGDAMLVPIQFKRCKKSSSQRVFEETKTSVGLKIFDFLKMMTSHENRPYLLMTIHKKI